ncbi:MAG: hypothetical protein QW590_01305 [Candidatus Bilamarchaeaceae archaeon]
MRTEKYGARIRKLYEAAIVAAKTAYECPKCHKKKLRRAGNAFWKCRSCGAEFAGGAYSFTTEVGEIASRLMAEYAKTSR